jgi:hypothetical protein
MKNYSLAMLLACIAFMAHAQKTQKYDEAKAKAQQKNWNDEKAEQYNDWEARIDNSVHSLKIVLPSGEARKYLASKCLAYGYDNFRFVSMGDSFVQLIYERESICVYKQTKYITTKYNSGGGTNYGAPQIEKKSEVSEKYYIRRRAEKDFIPVNKASFASKFSKYFEDCPYLYENIKNKMLGAEENDLTAIAAIYDRECAPGKTVIEKKP